MDKKTIFCILGTRPEAIKMAPIIYLLKKHAWARVKVIATAQHREILDQMLALFNIVPDYDLNVMELSQTIPNLISKLLPLLTTLFENEKADAVIAEGDTATVLVAGLAAFYSQIAFYHVEAGLRSGDLNYPFPEEMHRYLADHLATLNFAPSYICKKNLLNENLPKNTICVTGNTVIDALLHVSKLNIPLLLPLDSTKRLVLLTAHRRESFGGPFLQICQGIRKLADVVEDIQIIYPVHPNPNIKKIAYLELSNHPRILLTEPLDYGSFVTAMKKACLIITDSGGIQEEAPVLGKPLLIIQDKTSRVEVVEAGLAVIAPVQANAIFTSALKILQDETYSVPKKKNLYGTGFAAAEIIKCIEKNLLDKDCYAS